MAVTTLPRIPALGGLYLRAARPHRGRDAGLPEVSYRVTDTVADPERLIAYQRLLGEPVDGTVPPGFVHVLAFPLGLAVMTRHDFPLRAMGLVHLSNAVTVHRPIAADEALDITTRAQDLRPHERGTRVDLVAEASVAGELVWRGVSTYLAKTAKPGRPPRNETEAPAPTARWVLDAGTGRRYAAVSGDRNPIHLSAATARPFGFRRAIAHGMYTAARALAGVGPARGSAYDWTVDFAAPVLLPGTVDLAYRREGPEVSCTAWDAKGGRRHFTMAVRTR